MEQSAGYSKNPWNNNPFWEKASAEPPLEWSERVAILEMAVFANDEIEVRNLLRANQPLIEPAEPNYEVKLTGETGAQKKNREVRNQEKQVGWENRVREPGEKECSIIRSVGTRRMRKSTVTFSMTRRRGATTGSTKETKPRPTHRHHRRLYDGFRRYFCDNQNLGV